METMMRRRRATHPISHYWGMVKDMDDNQKLELVTLLIDSVRQSSTAPGTDEKLSKKRKLNASDYAGIWDDDHFIAAEEINRAVRDARQVKSSRDDIWNK